MKEVADRFAVSRSWVNNLVQRQKQIRSVAAKPHGGGSVAKVNATHYPILEAICDEVRTAIESTGAKLIFLPT